MSGDNNGTENKTGRASEGKVCFSLISWHLVRRVQFEFGGKRLRSPSVCEPNPP